MQRLDLAVNEKLSKKLISDRPSLGNIDLLKKYYSSISTLIYESRLHFKHLPLGYFIRPPRTNSKSKKSLEYLYKYGFWWI